MAPLLADLEEELAFDGVLCLHHFTWMQDIGGRPDEHDQILRTARLAYDEMRRRHPSARLGWVTWPHVTPGTVEPADPGTEPDFLLDPDGPSGVRLLALVEPG